MTLQQLVMYLWGGMPLYGWLAIVNCALLLAGVIVVFEGRAAVRATSSHSKMISVGANGQQIETESFAVGTGYEEGRRTVRLGYIIALFAIVGLIAALSGI